MIAKIIRRLLGLNTLGSIYNTVVEENGQFVFESVRNVLDIRLDVAKEAQQHIPDRGPVIVVANHPTGGMDGILLASYLQALRNDVKILSHLWFAGFEKLAQHMFFVVPQNRRNGTCRENLKSMKTTIRWLKKGGMLLVYPAGEVSYLQRKNFKIIDPPWQPGLTRLVLLTRSSVLPVYFKGRNSLFYQVISLLNPGLRRFLLARELLNKRGKTLQMKVGRAIPFEELAQFASDEEMTQYLRTATYQLNQSNKGSNARNK